MANKNNTGPQRVQHVNKGGNQVYIIISIIKITFLEEVNNFVWDFLTGKLANCNFFSLFRKLGVFFRTNKYNYSNYGISSMGTVICFIRTNWVKSDKKHRMLKNASNMSILDEKYQ